MLSYKIKYTNLFDQEVEETVRFHLTQDEMMRFLQDQRKKLYGSLQAAEDEDYLTGYQFVRDMVVFAYGERSEDGRRFEKSDDIKRNLTESPLIDAVMEKLFETEATAQAFIDGVFPPKMRELMNNQIASDERHRPEGKSKK